MSLPRTEVHNGIEMQVDFTEDEVQRRMEETIKRCMGMKPTFNLETGQPYEGPQLSRKELKRRGYD